MRISTGEGGDRNFVSSFVSRKGLCDLALFSLRAPLVTLSFLLLLPELRCEASTRSLTLSKAHHVSMEPARRLR